MTIRKLEKPEWRPFLDVVSKLLEAKNAEIEIAALDLGDQVLAEWLPLLGITYDPNDDVETPVSPFADDPLPRSGVHWVKPRLVAQIAFTEWTRDDKLRHPRFLGLRDDKRPQDVARET
jgi:hypothetical protein